MADISAQPVLNISPLINSFGESQANQGLTRAQTGLVGQQALAAQIANQRAAAMLPLYMRAVQNFQGQETAQADQSGVAPTASGAPQPDSSGGMFNPQLIDAQLRQKFFVNPAGTPQEQQQILSASITGDPGLIAYAKEQRDMNVKSRTAEAAKSANDLYDEMASVVTAPDNGATALATLRAVAPNTAKQIEQQYGNNAEAAALEYAKHLATISHQYTNRPVKADNAGIMRDEVTQLPVVGVPKTGMSQKDWADLAKAGSEPTNVVINGRETPGVERWKAEGYKSLASWTDAHAPGATDKTGTPMAAPGPTPSTNAQMAAARVSPASQGGPQRMGGLSGDEVNFVTQGPKAPSFMNTGSGKPTDAEGELQKEYAKNYAELRDESGADFTAGQSTLTAVNRARNILAQNPTLGPGSAGWAAIKTAMSNWLPTMLGGDFANKVDSDAALRQELGKVLGQDQINKMLKDMHGEGAKVSIGARESELILSKLSADPQLARGAIEQMLQWEQSDAQYRMQKARVARAWLNSGNDVQQFEQMYRDQYPQQNTVQTQLGTNTQQPPPATTPAATPTKAALKTGGIPAQAVAQLKEGIHTTFANGQVWTLQNGQPVKVK